VIIDADLKLRESGADELIQKFLLCSDLYKLRIPGMQNGAALLLRIPGRRPRWVRLFFDGSAVCHVLILTLCALVPP
jgi:hypothetical protein